MTHGLTRADPSPVVAILTTGRYRSIRRGHGGHRVRGAHAPPAAPPLRMGA